MTIKYHNLLNRNNHNIIVYDNQKPVTNFLNQAIVSMDSFSYLVNRCSQNNF